MTDECDHFWTRPLHPINKGGCWCCGKSYVELARVDLVLTPDEVAAYEDEARIRVQIVQTKRLGKGHGEPGYNTDRLMARHRPGAAAEAALCHWLDVEWQRERWRANFSAAADLSVTRDGVVHQLEARGTFSSRPKLRVYSNDPKIRKCILVRTKPPDHCTLMGWLFAGEARKKKWLIGRDELRPGSPKHWACWHSVLRGMDTLWNPRR